MLGVDAVRCGSKAAIRAMFASSPPFLVDQTDRCTRAVDLILRENGDPQRIVCRINPLQRLFPCLALNRAGMMPSVGMQLLDEPASSSGQLTPRKTQTHPEDLTRRHAVEIRHIEFGLLRRDLHGA